MDKILIVGSGASAVHFAYTVLNKGYEVLMLDVGREKSPEVNPNDGFSALKANLQDPAKYFLGSQFEGVIYPENWITPIISPVLLRMGMHNTLRVRYP